MRGIDKSIDVSALTPQDVAKWLVSSNDAGIAELGHEVAKKWGLAGYEQETINTEIPINDLLTVLLLSSKLIEYDPETRKFKRFTRGTNATIAKILFGSKLDTGGSYNKSIQQIKAYLLDMWGEFATTELQQPEIAAEAS